MLAYDCDYIYFSADIRIPRAGGRNNSVSLSGLYYFSFEGNWEFFSYVIDACNSYDCDRCLWNPIIIAILIVGSGIPFDSQSGAFYLDHL